MRALRSLGLVSLGAFAGVLAAARIVRYALPSRGDAESDDVANSLLGGIALTVPPGWRLESSVQAIEGGVAIAAPEPDDPRAPRLVLDGRAVLGGVALRAKP